MDKHTSVTAGIEGKSDLMVSYDPSVTALDIRIESSVGKQFGRHIRECVAKTLAEFGITQGRLTIKDDGALDHVISSRIESAFRHAGHVRASEIVPPLRDAAIKDRPRRSRLYIPGNAPDLQVNAGLFGADCCILDLEDSVSPTQKPDARVLVRRTLELGHLFFQKGEIIVRINPLTGPFGHDDLNEIVPALPHVILIPKCEAASDIIETEQVVTKIERKYNLEGRILFMPLIETARGVVNATAVATASARNVALCFGAEDFTRDLGVTRSRDGRETLLARQQIVLAAKAAEIQAIDTVFSDVGDEQGLYNSASEARSLGFSGKGVIHPCQISVVHRAFAPTSAEIEEAKKIVAALREAEKTGSGVIALGSKMIDAPVAARAKKLIEQAKSFGIKGLE
ncbi:MAG: citrate lyase subunit gamma [Candidatus Riflebacteria bacterium]|nr:citrate lyase subunit gamma [Candidatus Riflebacteria bacterium]